MLSIWKRTWKEKVPSVNSQQGGLDGSSGGASPLDVAAAVHPSDTMSSPLSPTSPKTKRSRKPAELDAEEPPPKRLKSKHRLNEVDIRPSEAESTLTDQILEQLKRENTIAVLPRQTAIHTLVPFLLWAIEAEQRRPSLKIKRHRTALLLVDSESLFHDVRAVIEPSGLSFGKYDTSVHSVTDPWADLLPLDVVVSSSDELLDSLAHGTLAITQIHALVNIQDYNLPIPGPMVAVMNDFYQVADPLSRPRILTITAVPTNQEFHFDSPMLGMEITLVSKVFGITDERRREILALPDCSTELVILYNKPAQPLATTSTLLESLEQFHPLGGPFKGLLRSSRIAFEELGTCASDLVWRRELKDLDAACRSGPGSNDEDYALSVKRSVRDAVKNWPFTMPNLDTSSRGFNVTHKFLRLVKTLESCEPYGESFRGIVYVQRWLIGSLILELFRTLHGHLDFLRPKELLKSSPEQHDILHGFTTGKYNLLIVMKTAADFQIPKASVVVCFDLCENQELTAHFRSLTRGRQSHFIHLVEQDSDDHRHILAQPSYASNNVSRWTESICDGRHNDTSPASPHGTSNLGDLDTNGDKNGDFIQDPTTSRRIYPKDSFDVVYRMATTLMRRVGNDAQEKALFEFEGSRDPPTYTCSVLLPGIQRFTGSVCLSKAEARQSACYMACKELASIGLLDYRLYPQLPKTNGASDTYVDDEKSSGTRSYHRKEPDFWKNSPSTSSTPVTSLYPMVLSPTHTDEENLPHSSIAILTRQPLPDLASIKLFLSGTPAIVKIRRGAPLLVDEDNLQHLHLYTIRICRAISNKPYDCPLANMAYFFAPLNGWTSSSPSDPERPLYLPSIDDYIPWNLVILAGATHAVPLKCATIEEAKADINDAIIQDRWVEYTRRYVAVRMRPDLTPLSKPLDSPREADYDSLLAFCQARRKGFDGLKDYRQPLIEVSTTPAILNCLNPASRPVPVPTKSHAKYLIPELCAKFTIPASTLRTACLLPSILRRIDDFLLVKELNAQLFDDAISEDLLLIALSAPSSGVECDYERLELLGDAFLKYMATIYVFVMNTSASEGNLHTARQHLISNKFLFQYARRTALPSYIQSKSFAPKLWRPPNFMTPSQPQNHAPGDPTPGPSEDQAAPIVVDATTERQKSKKKKKNKAQDDIQWLGDKAIADVAEALIGAGYMSGGRDAALKVAKALGLPLIDIDQWSDFGHTILAPPPREPPTLKPGSLEAVESLIGHKIMRPHLLAQALTHASSQACEPMSYERLEFVGDAILDFLVIRHLFERDQQLNPGGLTLLKGAMVSNAALAAVCVWSGLHDLLLHESYAMATSIHEYATRLRANQEEEYRLAKSEGRPPGQYWLELEPPKAVSDVVESLIGAIYISDNFSPVGVEALFDNVLKPFYDKHVTLKTLSHHPTKILFELFQAQGCQRFKIIKDKTLTGMTRCSVLVHDVILTSEEDHVATIAARRACFTALDALEGDAGFLARTCDCRTNAQPTKKEKKEARERALALEFEDDNMIVEDAEGDDDYLSESETEDAMILE
ncbi:Dicer-like protein 1 [Hypsizygus marmoreus]|uniref:Dicer-like protein 1 n=1 Tax=Hypsizygus marmoreus TaxID=39966 RepID=A0A369JTJ0_HYPMA|nr:Dicer-like protein 1 [Hypsizygus marmoreus]